MLKEKAIRAVGWTVVEQLLLQGLTIGLSIALARIFTPSEFGTIALLGIFIGLSRAFIDGGFASALVQKKECTQEDLSTAFWFNFTMSVPLALGLYAMAPMIADYFGNPVLAPIARCLAPLLVVGSTTSVHQSLFSRNLDIKTPLKISVCNMIAGGGTSIAMGLMGYGVWSLVGQGVVGGVVQMLLTWYWSRWRPSLVFSAASFRALFGFGGYLFLSGIFLVIYQQLYSILIAKRYGTYDLGIYNRGDTTARMVSTIIGNLAGKFAFPLFSQLNDERERMRRAVRMAVRGIMFINIPAMLGLCAVAEPLVQTLYGPKWLPAVPFLSIFALGSILLPLHYLNLDILKAMGQSGRFFKLEMMKRAVALSFIAGGAYFGIYGLAWSTVAASVAAFVMNSYYTGRTLQYGALSQMRDCLPAFLCSLLMLVGISLVDRSIELMPILRLATLCSVGGAIFLGAALLFRVPELHQGIDLVKILWNRASSRKPA